MKTLHVVDEFPDLYLPDRAPNDDVIEETSFQYERRQRCGAADTDARWLAALEKIATFQ